MSRPAGRETEPGFEICAPRALDIMSRVAGYPAKFHRCAQEILIAGVMLLMLRHLLQRDARRAPTISAKSWYIAPHSILNKGTNNVRHEMGLNLRGIEIKDPGNKLGQTRAKSPTPQGTRDALNDKHARRDAYENT
jgi:hypothetical protein